MAQHIPGPLYYAQLGKSGLPMIFLHSTPDDHRFWMYQQAYFSAKYRTIAVDLAGYGRSPIPQEGVTIPDQAEACWEIVDAISSGPCIVQGNSMGSHIALHMASQRPDRVPALILSGIGWSPGREPMKAWAARYQKEGIALRHHQVLDHLRDANKTEPFFLYYADMVCALNNPGTLGAIIAMNHALADAEPDAFFRGIKPPTVILEGEDDRSKAHIDEIQKRIPNCAIKMIANAGHACNLEAPWEYNRLATAFLEKLGL
jgi:pimeloyl-ACP methyl ester carboxylesterase